MVFLADLKDQMKETLRQNPLKLYAQVKNLDKEPYEVDLGEVGTPNNGGNLHGECIITGADLQAIASSVSQ